MAPPPPPPSAKEPEKDGEWVNSQLLQDALPPGASVLRIAVHRATAKGDNFMSVIYRTRVEYRDADSEVPRALHLIVKGLPPGEFIQQYIQELDAFGREIAIYNTLPRMYAFADSRLKVGAFERFSANFHKCSRPDTLILDDLKQEGFVMVSRKKRLDLSHSLLVIRKLARLHALSVSYAKEHTDFFSKFPDTLYVESNRVRIEQFVDPMFNALCQEIKKWDGFIEIGNKIERKMDTLIDRLLEETDVRNSFKNVLIHGDCWVNNMMFKYSDTGELSDFRFVDYQICRVSSPALDLNYFIYSSPQKNVRINYYDDLLLHYCNEFNSMIEHLGCGEEAISYEDICSEMKRTALFGFIISASIQAIVLANPEDTLDLS